MYRPWNNQYNTAEWRVACENFLPFVTVWYVLHNFTQALVEGSGEDPALEIKRYDLKWVV
jgi:hypothetical protein